jgi:hypothetical protein
MGSACFYQCEINWAKPCENYSFVFIAREISCTANPAIGGVQRVGGVFQSSQVKWQIKLM